MATYASPAAVRCARRFLLKDSALISHQICLVSSAFCGKGKRPRAIMPQVCCNYTFIATTCFPTLLLSYYNIKITLFPDFFFFCCVTLTFSAAMFQGYSTCRACSSSASSCSSDSRAADTRGSRETVEHYDRLVHGGFLNKDTQQRRVLQQLVQLQHTLKTYSNSIYLNSPRVNPTDASSQHQSGITAGENTGGEPTEKVMGLL